MIYQYCRYYFLEGPIGVDEIAGTLLSIAATLSGKFLDVNTGLIKGL